MGVQKVWGSGSREAGSRGSRVLGRAVFLKVFWFWGYFGALDLPKTKNQLELPWKKPTRLSSGYLGVSVLNRRN